MKQVVFKQYSANVDVLEVLKDATKPEPKKNEVVVQVKAASLNPLDWKIRKGEMKFMTGNKFPKKVGIDFAGIIDSVGTSVTTFQSGDEVFGALDLHGGAIAEYVVVSVNNIWKKPTAWAFAQAASVPIVGSAAYAAFDMVRSYFPKHTKESPPLEVLVYGATGGLGMLGIQLTKDWNISITAVCSTAGVPLATKWGAANVIDYKKDVIVDKLVKGKYDGVLDLSGKFPYTTAKPYLKPHAIYIDPAPTPASIIKTLFTNLLTKQQNKPLMSAVTNENMTYFVTKADTFDIEINKSFPIDQVQDAYNYAEKGSIIGKVVIEI